LVRTTIPMAVEVVAFPVCRPTRFCTKRRPFCATHVIRCNANSLAYGLCGTVKIKHRNDGGTFANVPHPLVLISKRGNIRMRIGVKSVGTFTTAVRPVWNTAIISWDCIPSFVSTRRPVRRPCAARRLKSTSVGPAPCPATLPRLRHPRPMPITTGPATRPRRPARWRPTHQSPWLVPLVGPWTFRRRHRVSSSSVVSSAGPFPIALDSVKNGIGGWAVTGPFACRRRGELLLLV
jgi:hypothetical protein